MQYLYNQDDEFWFMDVENYEQIVLKEDQVGDAINYLMDNLDVDILFLWG